MATKEFTVMGHTAKINPTGYVAGLCGIILGLLLLFCPNVIVNVMMYCLGGICIVLGLVRLIRYIKLDTETAMEGNDFMGGLAFCAGGVIVILFKDLLLPLPPLLFGFLIMLGGFYKIQCSYIFKRMQSKHWYVALFPAVISIAAGILLIINSRSESDLFMRFLGGGIVYECGCDLIFRKFYQVRLEKLSKAEAAADFAAAVAAANAAAAPDGTKAEK